MILLLGGTSETAPIAESLASSGFKVLVSTATDNELNVGDHKNIERRMGRLSLEAMESLMKEMKIEKLVDATHPFAQEVRQTARDAATNCNVPYFTYLRPNDGYDFEFLIEALDHDDAAEKAFSIGKPVLLTTGSRNLVSYVRQARKSGISLAARVLPHAESLAACKEAGLSEEEVIGARGPFSIEDNLKVIDEHSIGVIVSKASGKAGGMDEKIESAKLGNCKLVVVKRPEALTQNSYDNFEELVEAVKR